MRTTLLLLLPTTLAFSIFPRAVEEKTTLNDINTLCTINFFSEPDAIICVKEGTSMTFTTKTTTYLRSNDDAMCCEADNLDKFATIARDAGPCELNAAGDGCKWTGTNRGTTFSTKGMIKVTAVKDGKAADASGSGSGSGSSGAASVKVGVASIVAAGLIAFLL
ncbi:hypothetical protein OQA88_3471 [Cercophora sp. LCS_1]